MQENLAATTGVPFNNFIILKGRACQDLLTQYWVRLIVFLTELYHFKGSLCVRQYKDLGKATEPDSFSSFMNFLQIA